MIARVAVAAATYAIDKPYSYRIPPEMPAVPGSRVQVPFGRGSRVTEGVVLAVESGGEAGLKELGTLLDETPLLTEYQLRMAAFLRERCFCTFFDAIRTLLPVGAWFDTRCTLYLTEDRSWKERKLRKPGARELLTLLAELDGRARESVLRERLAAETFDDAVTYLLGKKWIGTDREFRPRVTDRTEKMAELAVPAEEAAACAAALPARSVQQKAVLELLCRVGSGAVKDICYYTGASAAAVNRLAERGLLTLTERPVLRCREIRSAREAGPLVLNEEQERAFEGLRAQMTSSTPGAALLRGVTGSGKTSVYIRLIRECLDGGRSALLLVPEIGLTPQLLGRITAHFGSRVAILHSALGMAERYDQWKRVRSGEADVVVGTRSAVFAPAKALGLLILDEEQEHSYRSENTPRYDARTAALWRGQKEHALVLLGSATPSVETMYRARTGMFTLYTLTKRYNGAELPPVEIVDMREELRDGNDLDISAALRDAIGEARAAGHQTVLLLNRRGNSRALVCVDCRESPECPRCSQRMTYHSANGRLMCHYCGFSQPVPARCPRCGGPLKALGTGTQKVQQELESLFPGLTPTRMDADTVSAANTHEKILARFAGEPGGVLLGTQMVAKGLDLPGVTLVGVVDADLGLYTGGYRAAETTFNMLTQAVGRAGRAGEPGRAILQTLVPEHQVLRLAAAQDYMGFYELELGLRRIQKAPPFGDRVLITFQGEEETAVLRAAMRFRDALLNSLRQPPCADRQVTVLGPAPCPVPKVNYHFRYRLTADCRVDRELRQMFAWLLREFGKAKDSRGVSAYADVNGFE